MFVGDKVIDERHAQNKNIIIVKDLPYNIETEWNLLTFTAWYAIIKNNMFVEYEYMCILEYDVILSSNFIEELYPRCKSKDVISFNEDTHKALLLDVNYSVCINYLVKQGLTHKHFDSIKKWPCSSNHCLKRTILEEFVNWYYPSCLFIKNLDNKKLRYYHERMFAIYCSFKKYNHIILPNILKHLQLVSHNT
jgi:GR25 family glycosyltransferase involved in LPS biosynthesis